ENSADLPLDDPRITVALNSLDEKLGKMPNGRMPTMARSDISEAKLYAYKNGGTAVAFSFEADPSNVYAQLLSPTMGREMDFIQAQIVNIDPSDRSKTSIE